MGSQGLKFRNLLFFFSSREMKFKLKHGSDLLTLLSKIENQQTALKDHLSHLYALLLQVWKSFCATKGSWGGIDPGSKKERPNQVRFAYKKGN